MKQLGNKHYPRVFLHYSLGHLQSRPRSSQPTRDKERCKEWEKCFSPPCTSAEVNKMYMTLWVSNNKPAISCTLRAFDIRMTQRPYRESRTPLHSCTRASLKAFRRNNCSFQSLLFLITFLVIAVTFLWLFQQWDTAAQASCGSTTITNQYCVSVCEFLSHHLFYQIFDIWKY